MLQTSIDGGCGLQGRRGGPARRGRAVGAAMSRDGLAAVGIGIGRHYRGRGRGRDRARGSGWGRG